MISILSILLFMELSLGNGNSELYELPADEIESHFDQRYYLSFGTEIFLYNYFYVKGSAKILLYMGKDIEAFPTALSSFIELGAVLNGLKVGWRHFCTHPVVPWYHDNQFLKFYDEGGDEFFIRYETGKIGVL